MKIDSWTCLHPEKEDKDDQTNDRYFDLKNAKDQCSRNRRCVGIVDTVYSGYFKLCMHAIYVSTASDKYEKLVNYLYKKSPMQGKLKYF